MGGANCQETIIQQMHGDKNICGNLVVQEQELAMVCLDVAGVTSLLVDEEEIEMRQGSHDITRVAKGISSSMLCLACIVTKYIYDVVSLDSYLAIVIYF